MNWIPAVSLLEKKNQLLKLQIAIYSKENGVHVRQLG
jgi:hypothetical protein